MERFEPGHHIAIRGHRYGKFRTAKAVVVVEDSPEMLRYWWPAGTTHVITTGMLTRRDAMLPKTMAELRRRRWSLTTHDWIGTDVLASVRPDSWAVVWHMWSHSTGEFLCWYVDLKRPHVRTPAGFDTYDLDLDIVVTPDGSWEWKDREEYDTRRSAGFITAEEQSAIEAAGDDMIEQIERGDAPFDGSMIGWGPEDRWERPSLADGWDLPAPR